MKVLVTGGTGFIGRNLRELLSGNHDLYVPTRKELDLLDVDMVRAYLQENRFDVVIHTANTNNTKYAGVSPYEVLDKNLRMFFGLEQCADYYGKMYYFGSGAEYDMRYYIPMMEEAYFGKHIPQDPYGFSKYIMAMSCRDKKNIYDLRLFGVYGKYEEWNRRFISNAICRALKGKDITIRKNVFFDYLWVEDLKGIMEWFIGNDPKYHHYNVCRGERIDLYSLACIVRDKLNIDCQIVTAEPGWKKEYTGNNQRLLTEMGRYSFSGYEECILKLCEYYKSNIEEIDESKLI